MVETEQVLPLGRIFLKLAAILVLTIGAIIVNRIILKSLIWPIIIKTKITSANQIFRHLESILQSIVILGGAQAAVRLFIRSFGSYERLIDSFFFLLYWCIAVYIVLSLISIASDWYLARIPFRDLEEIDNRTIRSIQYISQLVFGFLSIIILLEHFGITEASLHQSLTALGIGGIIIGLAAQNTLSDIIAGIAISIDRPFRIGDRILIEKLDTWGDVIEISWRSTRILTRDNREVSIPNSVIGKEFITNYSLPGRMFRVETFVVVSYGPDIEYVRNLILEALKHEAWIMHNKPTQALVSHFTEFGVEFKVRCWIENFMDTRISEDRLNTAIYKALINANIEVPSLHVIIHVTSQENGSENFQVGKDFQDLRTTLR